MRMNVLLLGVAVTVAACGACGGSQQRSDAVRPGAQAPDVRGEDQNGVIRRLSAERGHPIVIYFYPKDGTPGCTREACAFRDAWDRFEAAGVRVWGISADSIESHVRFAREHRLQFPLLSDPDLHWARAFGVGSTLGLAHRVTFLIDRDGKVAKVYPDVDPGVHVNEVLADVAALPGTPSS